jgi:hypothetical protein
MSSDSELWWGFSDEHAWIVLDRADPRNVPGSPIVYFFRSSDSTELEIPRTEWDSPKMRSARNYIASITNADLRSLAEVQLERFIKEYDRIRQRRLEQIEKDVEDARQAALEERNRVIREKHKRHLSKLGISGRATTRSRWVRYTLCWNCQTHINSDANLGCTACNGVICHQCGSCLCGWQR